MAAPGNRERLLAHLLLYGAGGALLYFVGREVLGAVFVTPRSRPLTLPSTKQGFVLSVLNATSSVWPRWPLEAKLLVIAQAALESGWGKTAQAQQGNNILNLAAGTVEQPAPPSVWGGPVMIGGDKEHSASGQVKSIRQRWRVYPSLEAGLQDYWKLLGLKRYQPAQEQLARGDIGFLQTIGPPPAGCPNTRGCYYTLPTAKYVARITPILEQVRALVPASSGGPRVA